MRQGIRQFVDEIILRQSGAVFLNVKIIPEEKFFFYPEKMHGAKSSRHKRA